MIGTLIANNWFINILAAFFISLLDSIAYLLLAAGYNIFYAVSQIDIFGGTDAGETIYNEITARIYTAISIVMVFVFAYYLIMMIVDPEGGKDKAPSVLVKETVIAFITVILLPTVFKYMSLFQTHVITNNTIGNIILGSGGSSGDENINYGKQVSLIVFASFYHPEGTAYADYFNNDGTMVSNPKDVCTGGGADSDVCDAWIEGLEGWQKDTGLGAIDSISKKSALYNTTNDEGGMYYMWIITTVVGVVAAWFFFSYAIDMGTRCVKLGFLQLIAPAPVLMKIFPSGKKTFDAWFAEIKKCYLEIFLRLAIIFFIVKLCTMVPTFITAVLGSGNNVSGGFLTKALATVCLILGLLKFAKDAPQLFKTLFASGSGLFAGLDWKPGMKRRINENEYAVKGAAMGLGAVGGLGSVWNRAQRAYRDGHEGGNGRGIAIAKAAGSAIKGIPRGVISGARTGLKEAPTEFFSKDMLASAGKGLHAGQVSDSKRDAKVKEYGHAFTPKWAKNHIKEIYTDVGEGIDDFKSAMNGKQVTPALIQAVTKVNSDMDGFLKNASVTKAKDDIDAKYEGGLKKLKEDVNAVWEDYDGVKYNRNGTGTYKETRSVTKSIFDYLVEEDGYTKGKDAKGLDVYKKNGVELHAQDVIKKWGETRTYDKEFDVQYKSMADLKSKISDEKYSKMADMANNQFKGGVAQVFANALKDFTNVKQELDAADMAKLQDKIMEAYNITDRSQAPSVEEFLKKMSVVSDENHQKTAADMKAINDIKTEMTNMMRNAEMVNQAEQAKKESAKAEKKEGGK